MEISADETQKDVTESVLCDNSTSEQVISPPLQDTSKKTRKDNRNGKDDKSFEHFMKSLNSVPLEEKVSLLCTKYVQLREENKKMQYHIKQTEKLYTAASKEKEQLQMEYNKNVLLKSKLENLCRELQKQNRAIKEESLLKLREEEERRKETQAKFQSTLSEISVLLQQNNEKNAQLREDNISMSEKFKSILQQYKTREEQVDKLAKQMSLEAQLADAKMAKANLEHQAEKERLLAELDHIKATMGQYQAKIAELQATEDNLRSQLAIYTDKYNEFQSALTKSNQFYGGFKEQMEMMSKKIKKLEKESLSWKQRWESSQTALIDMCGERQASEERAASVARQLAHMQGLCRTLQAERTVLLNTLKENDIERPPLPTPPPAPPSTVQTTGSNSAASNTKVDMMAANCAKLKQNLAQLQTQLNVLTNNQQNTNVVEPPKQEKQKKSKSKKNKDKQRNHETTAVPNAGAFKKPTEDMQLTAGENNVEKDSETTVVNKTLETLIQAIHNANTNLCDLKVEETDLRTTNNAQNDTVNEVLDAENKNDDLINEEKHLIDEDLHKTKEELANDVSITANTDYGDVKVDNTIEINDEIELLNGINEEHNVATAEIANDANKIEISNVDNTLNPISTV